MAPYEKQGLRINGLKNITVRIVANDFSDQVKWGIYGKLHN